MGTGLELLVAVTAVGCLAVGGVFFAFSAFVLQGLARTGDDEGIAVMQAINVTAVTPAFMAALFGTGLLALATAVAALVSPDADRPGLLVAGAGVYVVGVLAVTIARNVPLNDRLAGLEPPSPDAARFWRERYLTGWAAWNHVRTVCGIAAGAALLAALVA